MNMKIKTYFAIIIVVSLLLCTVRLQDDDTEEVINYDDLLFNDLMENYNPLTLPQDGNAPARPTVRIQLEIYGVSEVDIMGSTVSFKVAFRQYWNDSRLVWDPSEYGNINRIWLQSDPSYSQRSWTSDMSIRQDAGDGVFSNLKYTQVRVSSNGACYYSMFGDVKVINSFDIANYPFDKQTISMVFGSWIYPDQRLHLEPYSPPFLVQDPSSWKIDNIEWEFGEHSVESIYSKAASGDYIRLNYIVSIQRNGGTIMVAVIIPGALITFLGLLFILLPRGDGSRTGFLATILLTEIMFLVMITSFVPLSKQVPTIGWLFLAYTVLLAILTLVILLLEKIQHLFVDDIEDEQKELIKLKKQREKDEKEDEFFQNTIRKSYFQKNQELEQEIAEKENPDNEPSKKQKKVDDDGKKHMTSEQLKDEFRGLKIKLKRVQKIITLVDYICFACGIIAFIIISVLMMKQIFQ